MDCMFSLYIKVKYLKIIFWPINYICIPTANPLKMPLIFMFTISYSNKLFYVVLGEEIIYFKISYKNFICCLNISGFFDLMFISKITSSRDI